MTKKHLILALIAGLAPFMFSILPTSAERACQTRKLTETSVAQCQPNEEIVAAHVKNGVMNVTCCCVSPTAIIAKGGICTDSTTVLPGSTTGKKGGFIQIIPNCTAGTAYSESENKCVAAAATDGGQKKKKKKKKKNDDD
ncbi:MAG: hypothetical protein AB7V40_07335 [Methyloceanibacter sp.]